MRSIIFSLALILLNASSVSANEYVNIPVVQKKVTSAAVKNVVLLDSNVILERSESHEDKYVVINLGIEAFTSACEKINSIEYVSSQASLLSNLNPSDSTIRVNTSWQKDCATGAYGDPQFVKFPLKFWISQRPIAEIGKPWPAPWRPIGNDRVQHFSFEAGMLGGRNQLLLFKLDFSEPTKVTLSLVKKFAYVQGEVINQ